MDTNITLSGIVALMYCQVSHCMLKSVEVLMLTYCRCLKYLVLVIRLV